MHSKKVSVQAGWGEQARFALVSGIGLLAAWWMASAGVQIRTPPIKHYNSYNCNTHGQGHGAFRILDLFRLDTDKLADRLCASSSIGADYASVEVVWMHRDQLDLREIVDQSYQLLLAKPELLRRLTQTHLADYVPLASYQEYVSQLIALKDAPALSSEFLAGKRFGLLDDPNSLSGYQVPKAALRQAGIDESIFTTLSFKSHSDLHRALLAGDVDLIASYSAADFGDARVEVKRLDLQRGLSGMQWYMHPALVDTPVHCELARSLARYPGAASAPASIVEPLAECPHAD